MNFFLKKKKFGAYASESFHVNNTYYGTGETFLFQLEPKVGFYPWFLFNLIYLFSKKTLILDKKKLGHKKIPSFNLDVWILLVLEEGKSKFNYSILI